MVRRPAGKSAKVAKQDFPQRTSKPRLLAGGNPQIPKADGDARVQTYIAAMPGWQCEVGRRLDALTVSAVPDVRKAVRWYGVAGKGWFLSFHTFTKYIKVAFFRGTSLRPPPPVESKHKEVLYLDVHENDRLVRGSSHEMDSSGSRAPRLDQLARRARQNLTRRCLGAGEPEAAASCWSAAIYLRLWPPATCADFR